MLGRLTWESVPYKEPIILCTGILLFFVSVFIVSIITYFKKWIYIWKNWIRTLDHKKIGIMYIIFAFIMLIRGFTDAIMMRIQQVIAYKDNIGYLPSYHYDQIFTVHGVIMIFFMAMPFMFGLMNIIVPLQIGARDVAFPFLNSLSLWLTVFSGILINISLFIGEFASTGWLSYPPLSGIEFSKGVGVDYWIWSLQVSGIGTLISGINFLVTIIKMRAPGMYFMRLPIFTWTILCSNILIIMSFPILTATICLLTLDRYLDMQIFTNHFGGNPMMYVNLIWAWGHPEVYILILPAFGIFSEVVATFCKKRLFGYKSLVYATSVITGLSFIVWLHHFFTMGAGADVNAFFGISTMIISIPTGVKIFNWLFTIYKGKIECSIPMLWTVGFLIAFSIGGMAGVLLSIPGVDFLLHNSLFLVAHFHNVIIGGVIFGYLAGLNYWFPKIFGFKLNEKLGKYTVFCWLIGLFVAFVPLYILGLLGMTRRVSYYNNNIWHILLLIAMFGTIIILLGIIGQILQLIRSIIEKDKNKDYSGDMWNGRTLEWSISSPPQSYNFANIPKVIDRDNVWVRKKRQYVKKNKYKKIKMPKDTSKAFIISLFSLIFSFSMVWYIWWLSIVGFIGIIITYLFYIYSKNKYYYINVEEIKKNEKRFI
ncbi:cytochrome o ubiquinol oxidase subunit I [Candidatus Portiera aleyrodidarum]|uniref:Cytochrome bo(3) ubiquinol oxidase subunit 1 n=1 Tax=Candidatus Portiera aleyrodidarum TaxID=91844 RepID=A0A6S6S5S2_9GAMM|nr:cytochrome o ubiquinol oxidase subunit I [Candidatus Portiera aleyrodidarum]CAA3706611.1 Ubiquinol oxidase subunit 1 [Candidatus Portiera aleyrodidarum]